ncbi:hypothetical protein FOCC_FOCC017264 [Frankliniella occidentalis]|nr:hypothetical protein FOCC_FOCC017264 [Frankliniella occidentalis]
MDVESGLQAITARLGRFHVVLCALLSTAYVYQALFNLSFVFTTMRSEHRCLVPDCETNASLTDMRPSWLDGTVLPADTCSPFMLDVQCGGRERANVTVRCDQWVYPDKDLSIMTEVGLVVCGTPLFAPESVRWLASKGRSAEAFKIINKAAKMNGIPDFTPPPRVAAAAAAAVDDSGKDPKGRHHVRVRRAGRVLRLAGGQPVRQLHAGGAGGEAAWARTAAVLLAKLFVTVAYTATYVLAAELFPTRLRHTMYALSATCGRLGSALGPQMPLLRAYMESLPLLVFGAVCFLTGLLALTVPETANVALPDTVEEAEAIGKTMKKRGPLEDIELPHNTASRGASNTSNT